VETHFSGPGQDGFPPRPPLSGQFLCAVRAEEVLDSGNYVCSKGYSLVRCLSDALGLTRIPETMLSQWGLGLDSRHTLVIWFRISDLTATENLGDASNIFIEAGLRAMITGRRLIPNG
jgi:hypothetical protein